MPRAAIARLESADHVPSFATLIRLSETLGIAFSIDIRPRSLPDALATRNTGAGKIVEEVHTDQDVTVLVSIDQMIFPETQQREGLTELCTVHEDVCSWEIIS